MKLIRKLIRKLINENINKELENLRNAIYNNDRHQIIKIIRENSKNPIIWDYIEGLDIYEVFHNQLSDILKTGDAPRSFIEKVANSKDWIIRSALSVVPNLDEDIFMRMVYDDNSFVRTHFLKKINDHDVIEHLLDIMSIHDKDSINNLALNPNLTSNQLRVIYLDFYASGNGKLAKTLFKHPNTPPDIKELFRYTII